MSEPGDGWIILIIVSWIASIFFAMSLAGYKGYNQATAFLIGLFFGLVGLLYFVGLPDHKSQRYLRHLAEQSGYGEKVEIVEIPEESPNKECAACGQSIPYEAKFCSKCGKPTELRSTYQVYPAE